MLFQFKMTFEPAPFGDPIELTPMVPGEARTVGVLRETRLRQAGGMLLVKLCEPADSAILTYPNENGELMEVTVDKRSSLIKMSLGKCLEADRPGYLELGFQAVNRGEVVIGNALGGNLSL